MRLRAGSMAGGPRRQARTNKPRKERESYPNWVWPLAIVIGFISMFSMTVAAWLLVASVILVLVITVVWLLKTGQVIISDNNEEEEAEKPKYRYERLTPEDLKELDQEFK